MIGNAMNLVTLQSLQLLIMLKKIMAKMFPDTHIHHTHTNSTVISSNKKVFIKRTMYYWPQSFKIYIFYSLKKKVKQKVLLCYALLQCA